jgi:hypothetical protein
MRRNGWTAALGLFLVTATACERIERASLEMVGDGAGAICVCVTPFIDYGWPPTADYDLSCTPTSAEPDETLAKLARRGWRVSAFVPAQIDMGNEKLQRWYVYLEHANEDATCGSEPPGT